MKIHMARPEACFQAATAEECLEELQKWSAHSALLPVLTLHEAVEMVCKGGMHEGMHETLAHLGALNLFAVISGKAFSSRILRVFACANEAKKILSRSLSRFPASKFVC